MLIAKIEELNLRLVLKAFSLFAVLILQNGCLMTKAQGDVIDRRVLAMENEVAKLRKVRHDLEIMLSTNFKNMYEKVMKLEEQVLSIRTNIYEESGTKASLLQEIAQLRNQIENAEQKFSYLEGRDSTVKNFTAPLNNDELFIKGEKAFKDKNLNEAIEFLETFLKNSKDDSKTKIAQYYVADSYKNLAGIEQDTSSKIRNYKKSLVYFQRVVQNPENNAAKEEALFQMGSILKLISEKAAAKTALKELLKLNKNSARAKEASKILSEL